jgi:YHS domain-containing protein
VFQACVGLKPISFFMLMHIRAKNTGIIAFYVGHVFHRYQILFIQVMLMVRDPVCNMNVNPEEPGATEKYNGKTYYFCCNKCKATFDKNRDRFSEKA